VLILGEGVTSRRNERRVEEDLAALEMLGQAARKANDLLGVRSLEIQQLPDNRMDGVDRLDVVKLVEDAIARLRPSIMYTHHPGDMNLDHRVVHDSVCVACRPYPGQPVKRLLFFEVLSSTDWRPAGIGTPFAADWYVDATATLERKLAALACYENEMRPWPHTRSFRAVEHLARSRGATVGLEAAEAFVLGRYIVTP